MRSTKSRTETNPAQSKGALVASISESGDLVVEYDAVTAAEQDEEHEWSIRINKNYKDAILLSLIQQFASEVEVRAWLDQAGVPYDFESSLGQLGP